MSEYIYDSSVEAAFLREQKREEIVRCRDCKHLIAHGTGCAYWDYCDIESIDGFCAWAQRRDA